MNKKARIFNQINTNNIQECIKKIIYDDQVSFIPEIWRWFNMYKLKNVIYLRNRLKDKTHEIILLGAKKTFDKSVTLHDRSSSETRDRGDRAQTSA